MRALVVIEVRSYRGSQEKQSNDNAYERIGQLMLGDKMPLKNRVLNNPTSTLLRFFFLVILDTSCCSMKVPGFSFFLPFQMDKWKKRARNSFLLQSLAVNLL